MWLPQYPAVLADDSVDRTSLLVVQAWHELLDPLSPDAVQAPALNLPLLLEDIAHVVDVAIDDTRWKSYLPLLAEELVDQRQNEKRIIEKSHVLETAITNVITGIRSQLPLAQLRQRVLLARTLYRDPVSVVVDDAKEIIGRGCLEKAELLSRLASLATMMQDRGFGEESIASLTGHHLRNDPSTLLDELCRPLCSMELKYQCTLALTGPEDGIYSVIEKSSFRRRSKRDQRGDRVTRSWEVSCESQFHVVVDVVARSARHAAELSLAMINARLNVQNHYLNNHRFSAEPSVLVYRPDGTTLEVEVAANRYFAMQPRKSASEPANNRIDGLGTRLEGRLTNALETNALALGASDPRTALANFWTALETIVGTSGEGAIGGRVAASISPLVAWKKFDTRLTYLSVGVHQHFKALMEPVDTQLFPNSTMTFFSADDVLAAVSGPARNPQILALFKACASSPLMLFRLHEAWKSYHDPASLKRRMDRSAKRISWQIHRIYRARNLLVHQGQHQALNWRLLRNAQDYVSTSLSRVMHDLVRHPTWSIDTSLEFHAMSFQNILDRLGGASVSGLTHKDLLPWQSAVPGRVVWPTTT